MGKRKASIKESGEEISQADWARFDAAVAREQAERPKAAPYLRGQVPRDPYAAQGPAKR